MSRHSHAMRTMLWALRARVVARRAVFNEGIAAPIRIPAPPRTSPEEEQTVVRVLARTKATCLVRSLVLQEWLKVHGEPVDVIIGIKPPSQGFEAHAWLDRPGEVGTDGFTELHRLPPSGVA